MKTKLYFLTADIQMCHGCGTCERLLPDFRKRYGGQLIISASRYHAEESIRESVRAVVDACPSKAIHLKRYRSRTGSLSPG